MGVFATGQFQDLVLRLPRETRPGFGPQRHGELTRPADHAVVMSAMIEEWSLCRAAICVSHVQVAICGHPSDSGSVAWAWMSCSGQMRPQKAGMPC